MTQTKNSQTSLPRLTGILFAVAAVTALILGLVNFVTADRIAFLKEEKTAAALREVLPGESYAELPLDGKTVDPRVKTVYESENGWVVDSVVSGSQGDIELVVGVDRSYTVTGVSIIESKETAGLGAKASDPDWRAQFVGADTDVAVSKDGGTIDALTGATITSRAVTAAVNLARETAAALS